MRFLLLVNLYGTIANSDHDMCFIKTPNRKGKAMLTPNDSTTFRADDPV